VLDLRLFVCGIDQRQQKREKIMIQVTAIYENGEIGYGEGETIAYAIDDCAASIPAIFENETVVISILKDDSVEKIKGRVYLDMNGVAAICDRVQIN
jgi:hypothetical protein